MFWLVTFVLLQLIYGAEIGRKRPMKGVTNNGCSINITAGFPQNAPVVLIVSGKSPQLALPVNNTGTLQLSNGEQMVLFCPGRGNKLQSLQGDQSSVAATCGNRNIKVNLTSYSLQDLGCSKKVGGEIYNTGNICGPKHAQMLELGYSLEDEWYPLISVCHIRNSSVSLYSKHVLRGQQIKKAEKRTSTRPSFQIGGDFYPGFSPEKAYRLSTQKKTLQSILDSNTLAEQYFSTTYFARGHLAPDADFVLAAYQYLTYFYVNTAPQWQSVNAGNWLSLEKVIRTFVKKNGIDLQIITGTYDVLKLEAESGKLREVYLQYKSAQNSQLPVPKYFWKIAYASATKKGIAFVLVNNPFINKVTLNEKLCTNICEETRWLPSSNVWRKLTNGYLYCCEIDSLRETISYIPKLDVDDILMGPN